MLGTKPELGDVVTMITWNGNTGFLKNSVFRPEAQSENPLTFCVAALVVWRAGLVKVILTGER